MNDHHLWLNYLKQEQKITIWGIELTLFDFPTSQTMHITKRDFESTEAHLNELVFNDDDWIVDLGANIGVFSILMAKKFPKAHILAVEPMPHNVENLKKNLEANGVKNVGIVPSAISGIASSIRLCQHPLNSGSASEHLMEDFYPMFEVPAMTLDDLFVSLPVVNFLKVDIEGAEHEVFRSFRAWDKLRAMSIEIHGFYGKTDEENKIAREALVSLLDDKIEGFVTIL